MAIITSTENLENMAKDEFIDDNFELAVQLYSQAIELSADPARLLVERAQANIKLLKFTEAVEDANKAIELAPNMAKAYLRKGTACLKLGEYQIAKTAFQDGVALAPQDSQFTKFIKECDARIAEENAKLPKPSLEKAAESTVSRAPNTASVTEVPVAKPKFRHEFYQKDEEGVVTIFAKRIPAESVAVDFGEQILSVTIDIPGEEPYHFQPRLFRKIIPAKCRYEVLSTKIEIRLAKAEPIQWPSLEYTDIAVHQTINVAAQRPSYPSSKNKIDWDKLEAQAKKEDKDEKLDGDAAVNKFFRDIFKDADEDTRRAMQKSFVESNGTVLSTNWKEVGQKTVEGSAPDGMEMKKWEY